MAGLYESQNIFRTHGPSPILQCHILSPHLDIRHAASPELREITRDEFLEYLLAIKLNNYSEQDNAVVYWSHLGSWLKGLEVTTIQTWRKIIQQWPLCSVILSTPVTRRGCHSPPGHYNLAFPNEFLWKQISPTSSTANFEVKTIMNLLNKWLQRDHAHSRYMRFRFSNNVCSFPGIFHESQSINRSHIINGISWQFKLHIATETI